MVKTYQQVNIEHREREREEHHERKHRKYTLLIVMALLVAFIGIMLAQNAQDTADINNIFEIVVNNTNLAPTVAGHPPGTGERVSGTTYWANDSPIEIFVFAHAMAVGDNAEIRLFINGTKVADTSGRPLGGAESSNKTIIAIIPKFSNYSVEFTNFHHYEWREYPVLSGKNGTLSINQSLVGSSFNATYEANISALQRNDTYFNGTVFPQSTNFRNDSIVINNNTLTASKVNKTGDTMTGNLNLLNSNINGTNSTFLNGSLNGNGNLLNGITPTFNGWTTNPGTSADLTNELGISALTTSGAANAGNSYIQYDLGISKRIIVTSYAHASVGTLQNAYIEFSDDGTNYYIVWLSGGSSSGQTFNYLSTNAIGKTRYIRFFWDIPVGGATINVIQARVYNI